MSTKWTYLREQRLNRGLSQVAFGEQLGLAGSTVNLIESGQSGGRPDTLKRIADYLGVTVTDLLKTQPGPVGRRPAAARRADLGELAA